MTDRERRLRDDFALWVEEKMEERRRARWERVQLMIVSGLAGMVLGWAIVLIVLTS